MGQEIITVTAGAQSIQVESITIEAALDHAARSFSFVIPGGTATATIVKPGTQITIAFNGDLVLTGYVDRNNPKLAKEGGQVTVSGRSKSQDLIDCAAINAQGSFENQTLLQIGQALDQFGVGVTSDQPLDPIDSYQVTPGETVFDCLEKLARKTGLTLTSPPDGTLAITKAGTTRHAGGLFEGQNFMNPEADLDWSNRHSDIIVRGQASDGTGDTALKVEATAKDTSIGRYRPVVIIEDGDLDQATAQKRADTRRDREAGESLKAGGDVQGFRDGAGAIWTPGFLVWIQSPYLDVTGVMLIKKATFTQSKKDGSITHFDLIDPRAFGGTSAKGSEAGAAWSIDDQG